MATILIADEFAGLRTRAAGKLSGVAGVNLVLTASDLRMARSMAEASHPDVLVLGAGALGEDGVEFVRVLREAPCGIVPAVVVAADRCDRDVLERAEAIGAIACVARSSSGLQELRDVVARSVHGQTHRN